MTQISSQEFDRWLLNLCDESKQIRASKIILEDPRLFPTPTTFSSPKPLSLISSATWTILTTTLIQPPANRNLFDSRIRLIVTTKLPEKALLIADNGFHTGDTAPRRAAYHFIAAYAAIEPTALVMGQHRLTPMLIRDMTSKADRVIQGFAILVLMTLSKQPPLRDFLVGAGLLPELKKVFTEDGVVEEEAGLIEQPASSPPFLAFKAIQTYATLTSVERKEPTSSLHDITTLLTHLDASPTKQTASIISKAVRNTLVHIPGDVMATTAVEFYEGLEELEDVVAVLREFARGPEEEMEVWGRENARVVAKREEVGVGKKVAAATSNEGRDSTKPLTRRRSNAGQNLKSDDPRWIIYQPIAFDCLRNLCIDAKSCTTILKTTGPIILRTLLTSPPNLSTPHHISRDPPEPYCSKRHCFASLVMCSTDVPSNLMQEVVSGLSSSDVCGVQRCSLDILSVAIQKGGEKLRTVLMEEGCLRALVVLMDAAVDPVNGDIARRCYKALQETGGGEEDTWQRLMKEWEKVDQESGGKNDGKGTREGKKKRKTPKVGENQPPRRVTEMETPNMFKNNEW
ncbi:hypothetical protein BC829DRAFT_380233 [Chytridium lagenaria]|nr:hypothetical protein BC829DRAFT_380233 [Chytridium lagenaria]